MSLSRVVVLDVDQVEQKNRAPKGPVGPLER